MTSRIRRVALVLALAGPSLARGGEVVGPLPIWPGLAPGVKEGAPPKRELPMRPGDTTARITDVSRPTITLHRPDPAIDTGAAVLICPGGAYNILAINKEGSEVAEWLASIGVTGVLLEYRVPVPKDEPTRLAPFQDAQRALGIVRKRAQEWKLDPARIGVLGFSAGGHLAARLSNNHAKRAYDRVDDADDVSCRPDFTLLIYPAYLVTDKAGETLAPEIGAGKESPPAFIMQTQDDGVRVECSLAYYLALKRAGVPAELHVYPVGGHGYGLRPSPNPVSSWPKRAAEWLRNAVSTAAAARR